MEVGACGRLDSAIVFVRLRRAADVTWCGCCAPCARSSGCGSKKQKRGSDTSPGNNSHEKQASQAHALGALTPDVARCESSQVSDAQAVA